MEWLNKFRYSIVIPYNDDSNSSKIERLIATYSCFTSNTLKKQNLSR